MLVSSLVESSDLIPPRRRFNPPGCKLPDRGEGRRVEIAVRKVRPGDSRWLKELVVESALYSVAHARDISNAEVRVQAAEDLAESLANDRVEILIAYNAETRERMGFLILTLDVRCAVTGEAMSLIDSLGVDPRFWGTPTVSRLVKRAAQLSHEHGIGLMSAFITSDNRRTMLKALRLGFEIEQAHLAAACGPDGVEPMPGREERERAHDVSRHERIRRRQERLKS